MAAELAQLIGDDDPSDYAAGQRPLDAETLERLRALGYLGGTGGGAGAALDPELRKINPKDRIAVFEGFNDGIDDAVELVANERWSEAEEALLELDELAPNHFIVRYYLGRAFLAQDRVEEAIEELEASLQLNPSYSFTYLQLATAYRKVDEPARAVELLREAINLLPDVSTFPMELGYLLHAQGDLDAALDAYLRGEAMAPDHAQLMRNMANLYLLRRQPQPAIVKLRRLTELEPGDGTAWAELGTALAAVGEMSAAGDALERAGQLEPTDARVHFNHALVLLRLQRRDSAVAALRRALQADPDFDQATALLRQLGES